MATLDPGVLRTELALQENTPVADGLGGYAESWSTVATLFALVEPASVRDVFGAGRTLEMATHRITIRARDGVANGMRFVKAERGFEILTIHDPDETGRYLVCMTRETGA